MPSAKASKSHKRKRQLSEAGSKSDLSPQPTAKRPKLEEHQRHGTPSSFWDNLSRQWLTRRALREFDRRTVWPTAPVPPHRTGQENVNLAKLKRFARHGGPSLSNIRGYPDPEKSVASNPVMDSNQSGSRKRARKERESGTSSSTRKSSAYDPAFKQHLNDHGIYKGNRAQKPSNWAEISERLAQPRPSLSPSQFSEAAFETFQQTNENALTENTVMSKAFPIITGTAKIPSQENLYFGNLKDLTDGSITKAKPDFYDGARPVELSREIREQLSECIEPSTKKNAPLLPNFFTEGKGPDGSAPVSELQAMYDGALGARGMHELRSYIDPETAYDDNAYTITSTYHGGTGTLHMYTTHPAPPKDLDSSAEYRMIQLKAFAMTSDPETFRQGATFVRNGRELMETKRGNFIASANAKALNTGTPGFESSTQSFASLSSNEPTRPESETSADELALGIGIFQTTNHTAPVQARAKAPPKESSNPRVKKDCQVKKRFGTGSPV